MLDTCDLVPLPLLADPAGYRPCLWDLRENPDQRAYWLGLFRRHFPTLLDAYAAEAGDRGVAAGNIAACRSEASEKFDSYLDATEAEPERDRPLTILDICTAREEVLRAVGIEDAYRLAKRRDTEHALGILPQLLEELDQLPETERRVALLEGVFAGNIYDLGATETVSMFTDQRVDFHAVRAQLKPRPWRVDHLDAWARRWSGPPHRAAVLFVDNAGPDVTLGMLPFARELLRRGTRVILTANATPSLNDITHEEMKELMRRVAEFDRLIAEAWAEGRLRLIHSGNHAPLIDLSRVSAELADTVREEQVDLVVLEGMGRAIESNFDARLRCDTLKLAMIKDRGVAEGLAAHAPGTELFDLILKFEPGVSQ
jgi:type II pantothenate kinase